MIKATIWIIKLKFKEDLFCSRRACPWRITDWTCPVQVFEAPTYHNLKKVKGVQVQASIIIIIIIIIVIITIIIIIIILSTSRR